MSLIQPKRPVKGYQPTGDVPWSGAKFLEQKVSLGGWHVIPCHWITLNPLKALDMLGVDTEIFRSHYTCPYLESQHYWAVPAGLLTRKLDDYRTEALSGWHRDYVFDPKWEPRSRLDAMAKPSEAALILLGLGYTQGTLASDGHGSIKKGHVSLDNGDVLQVWFWEWFNK